MPIYNNKTMRVINTSSAKVPGQNFVCKEFTCIYLFIYHLYIYHLFSLFLDLQMNYEVNT